MGYNYYKATQGTVVACINQAFSKVRESVEFVRVLTHYNKLCVLIFLGFKHTFMKRTKYASMQAPFLVFIKNFYDKVFV